MKNYYLVAFLLAFIDELLILALLQLFPLYITSGRIISMIVCCVILVASYYFMKKYLHAKHLVTILVLATATSIPFMLVTIFSIFYFGLAAVNGAVSFTLTQQLRDVLLVILLLGTFPTIFSIYFKIYN